MRDTRELFSCGLTGNTIIYQLNTNDEDPKYGIDCHIVCSAYHTNQIKGPHSSQLVYLVKRCQISIIP